MIENRHNEPTTDDKKVEDLVDKLGISYHEARLRLGVVEQKKDKRTHSTNAAIEGPYENELSYKLNDLLHTGFNSDGRKFITKVSLASIHEKITPEDREILYSRKK